MKRIIYVCVTALLLLCVSSNAGEDAGRARAQMLKDSRKLNSPITTERIAAMQSISTTQDPQLLAEFKIVDKLMDMANNNRYFMPVRRSALKTLVILYNNSISIPGLLDMLSGIIDTGTRSQNLSRNLQLKLISLNLLIDVASAKSGGGTVRPEYDKIFLTLTKLWDKKQRMPLALQVAMLQAIGSFGDKTAAVEILTKSINDKNDAVSEAAVRGLVTAIQQRGIYRRGMMDELAKRLVTAKTSSMRVALLNALQIMYDNGILLNEKILWKPSNRVSETVNKMLKAGEDAEARSSVRYLMRLSGQDPSVTDQLLGAARPDPKRPLSYETIKLVNSALIDVMLNIANTKNGPVKYKKEIDSIIQHMFMILNPSNRASIPVDLRQSMIMGLGCATKDIDRQEIVKFLIALLENESNQKVPSEMIIQEIEDALMALTGVSPFQIVKVVPVKTTGKPDGGPLEIVRVITPDIDAWKAWYQKNSPNLAAGKVPYAD